MGFTLGYSSQPDLYQPSVLLEHAVLAEKAGFETLWLSDHFHPWSHTGANESHTWVIIGAAAARTARIKIGTAVMCPLFRYNPAITAQAFATLRAMFPGRIFISVGTGEAMNEVLRHCRHICQGTSGTSRDPSLLEHTVQCVPSRSHSICSMHMDVHLKGLRLPP